MNKELHITNEELWKIATDYGIRKKLSSDSMEAIYGFINYVEHIKLAEETEIKE